MTLVLIGPVCEDLIIIGNDKSSKVGGASFYQSFVYEEFYNDYLAIVNASSTDLIDEFPDESKVRLILKGDTHYFINEYPNKDNLDIRNQSTNFADIPIAACDLKDIFDDLNGDFENFEGDIDAFVLNPLNSNDFPIETLEYLHSFNKPIFISLQGFLRFLGADGSMELKSSDMLDYLNKIADYVFLDENEANIIRDTCLYKSNELYLIVTNGSKGSRIVNDSVEDIMINAVECDNIIDATGCGDTYMAAFISSRLNGEDLKEAGDFASLIASKKLEVFGPYKNK